MKGKMNLEQFKKRTHILRVVLQVLFYCSSALAAIMAVSIPVILLADIHMDTRNAGLFLSMNGTLRYSLKDTVLQYSAVKPALAAAIAAALIMLLIISLVLYNLYRILEAIEKKTPFISENVKRLSRIGLILVLGSIAYPVADYAMTRCVMDLVNLPGISVNYSVFNAGLLFTGLLVLVLSGVFRYGSYLQKEHDATV